MNISKSHELDIETLLTTPLPRPGRPHWSNYVAGVARVLCSHGVELKGADLLIHGEVPIGSGLSSSAALELAVAMAMAENAGVSLAPLTLALLCQQAENQFVGTRCGIMDQFAAACGRAGHALLIDCRSTEYQLLPLEAQMRAADRLTAVRLVISNTAVRHQLASGEYNLRREQCERAVQYLNGVAGNVTTLRDVSLGMLQAHRDGMDEVLFRRCRHVVLENARVEGAARALAECDFGGFGEHMYESHRSLRDDFEVSCEELDLMVRLASEIDGVYGARMTGGGFGGCTVNLVRDDAVERFQAVVGERYLKATGRRSEIYICGSVDGVARVAA
jgi:galactokinase